MMPLFSSNPCPDVSSSRRKSRKAHFAAPSSNRRTLMSSALSKDLRKKYNIRSLPIRKADEVTVVRGGHKDTEGKVIRVYRKKFIVHIERLTKDKVNGTLSMIVWSIASTNFLREGSTIQVPLHASNLVITKLHLDKDRKNLIERKQRKVDDKNKGKITEVAPAATPMKQD